MKKKQSKSITYGMDDVTAQEAIASISNYLSRYYGKKLSYYLMNTTLQCRRHM